MSDFRNVYGERINLHQRSEVREWGRYLGVSADAIRSAAAAVGDQAEKVQEHLKRNIRTLRLKDEGPR